MNSGRMNSGDGEADGGQQIDWRTKRRRACMEEKSNDCTWYGRRLDTLPLPITS